MYIARSILGLYDDSCVDRSVHIIEERDSLKTEAKEIEKIFEHLKNFIYQNQSKSLYLYCNQPGQSSLMNVITSLQIHFNESLASVMLGIGGA